MSSVLGPPVTDLAQVFPELGSLRGLVLHGDYPAVEQQLLEFRRNDENDFVAACRVVAETDGVGELLERWLLEHPHDLLARSLLAQRGIVEAWQVRTRHHIEHVSDDQWEQFHAGLRVAEQNLIEICAIGPDDPLPWLLRIMTARGLELGHSEGRRRYDRLAELDAHHASAQRTFLQQLCPKWGGTWEDVFTFVRPIMAGAADSSPEQALIAHAHLERCLELDVGEGSRYLNQPDVIGELIAASDRMLSTHGTLTFDGVAGHSAFGLTFALAGLQDCAIPHFAVLGPAVDERLWGYVPGMVDAINQIRSRALSGA